jgi:isopenicillin-N epimerase
MSTPHAKLISEFDVPTDYLFMNSGSSSIAPKSVREKVKQLQDKAEHNPTAALFEIWRDLWEAQKDLAGFLNADPQDLFIRNNISEAMNNFILGLPLSEKDEILYSDLEYGAIKNICKFRAERDGLKLREFSAPRSEQNAADTVIAAIRPETKMLVLSHVFTANGLILPIEEIAKETRRRGIYLVIDGAHSVGSLPLDFSKLQDVDCYGGNLHKWLMGPKGTAFGWVHKNRKERLVPLQAGWTTFGFLPEHSAFGEGSSFQGKFMPIGSCDFSSYLAIPEIISFWQKWGAKNIRERLYGLQESLRKRLEEIPALEFISPMLPARGPLLAYRIPKKFSENPYKVFLDLYEREKLQIVLPFLDGSRCLRLSPHIYNSDEEIAQTVNILQKYFR